MNYLAYVLFILNYVCVIFVYKNTHTQARTRGRSPTRTKLFYY
jgi:hypothetical protein